MQRFRPRLALLLIALITSAEPLRADDIYLFGNGGEYQLTAFRQNVKILRADGARIVFRSTTGSEQSIEYEKILRIAVTGDPSLTSGDDAYALQEWDKAVDHYLKAIRTADAWKVQWITPRLSNAAKKTNRFDAGVTAYLGFARIDPAAAIHAKPALPAKGSKFLDDAAKQIDTSLRSAASDGEKQALLSLLVDVQMARGDTAATELAANQLMSIAGETTDPKLASMVIDIRLEQAKAEVQAGRATKVADLIRPIQSKLTDPPRQATAQFVLAQASQIAAGQDKTKLLDVAIDYMQIAAIFESAENRPMVGESLLAAAMINEQIGETDAARSLYGQIELEFPATPVAQTARSRRQQLQ